MYIFYLDFCNFLQTPHFENLPHQLSLLQVQRRLQDIAPVVKGMDISEYGCSFQIECLACAHKE